MRIVVLIYLFIVSCSVSNAQFTTNPILKDWQLKDSSKTKSLYISLGHFEANFGSSYRINKVLNKSSVAKQLDFNKLLEQTKDQNNFYGSYDLDLINIQYNLKQLSLSLGFGTSAIGYVDMPRRTVELASLGNAPFLEEQSRVQLESDYLSYYSFSLGASLGLDKLFIGLDLNFYDGIQQFRSRGFLDIQSNEALTLMNIDRSLEILSTGFFSYNGLGEISVQYDAPFITPLDFKNIGFGASLELAYKLTNQTIALNIDDIGVITWGQQSATKQYVSSGLYEYDGIEISDVLTEFDVELVDTLSNVLGLTETNVSKYTTAVPLTIKLQYQNTMLDRFVFHAGLRYTKLEKLNYWRMNLHAERQINSWFNVGIGLYPDANSFDNIGLTLGFDFNNVDLFYELSNVPASFNPYGYKQFAVKGGLNIRI